MARVANAILSNCKRPIDYNHMPVPIERTDRAYFEPFQNLSAGKTQIFLGLLHHNDLEGTKARIAAAGQFVRSFGVSTECGMGRKPPEQLQNIFDVHTAVSTPVERS